MAIDGKSGKQIWKTKVDYPPGTPRIVCCGVINRGAALFDGKVYRTTLDANVVALEFGTRPFIDGWEAQTGQHLWRTYTIPGACEP